MSDDWTFPDTTKTYEVTWQRGNFRKTFHVTAQSRAEAENETFKKLGKSRETYGLVSIKTV